MPGRNVGFTIHKISGGAPIRIRTPEGMAVLAKLISLAGLAMSLAHATAPLSGFEHVISHMLDLQAELHEAQG